MANQKVTVDLALKIDEAIGALKDFQAAASSSLKDVAGNIDVITKATTGFSAALTHAGETAAGFLLERLSERVLEGIHAAFDDLTSGVAEFEIHLVETSAKLGLTVESMQELEFAAGRVGLSTGAADTAFQNFTKNIADAANGTGRAGVIFKQLGIDLRDSNKEIRPTEDLLNALADRLETVPSKADQVRIAFRLFGAEGVNLVNVLSKGSTALSDVREQAQKYGLVTEEDADRAERYQISQKNLNAALTGLRVEIGSALLPVLTNSANNLANFLIGVRDFFAAVIENMPEVLRAFEVLGSVLAGVFLTINRGAIISTVRTLFTTIVSGASAAAVAVRGLGTSFEFAEVAGVAFEAAVTLGFSLLIAGIVEGVVRFKALADSIGGFGNAATFVFLQTKLFIYDNLIQPLDQFKVKVLQSIQDSPIGSVVSRFVDLKGAIEGAKDSLEKTRDTISQIKDDIAELRGNVDVNVENNSKPPPQPTDLAASKDTGPQVAAGIVASLQQGGEKGAIAIAQQVGQAFGPYGQLIAQAFAFAAQGGEKVREEVGSLLDSLPNLTVKVIDGALAAVETVIDKIPDLIPALAEKLPEIFARLIPALGKIFGEALSSPFVMNRVGAALAREMPKAAAAFAREMPKAAQEFINSLKDNATGSGGLGGVKSVGGAVGGFFGGLFASGGDVPSIPGTQNDKGVIGVSGGEDVLDQDTNKALKRFLASGGSSAPKTLVANLVINDSVLASTILDLSDRGFRLSR